MRRLLTDWVLLGHIYLTGLALPDYQQHTCRSDEKQVGAVFERYLAFADDEEGVSSGPLPDDVFFVLIVSLDRHKFTAWL